MLISIVEKKIIGMQIVKWFKLCLVLEKFEGKQIGGEIEEKKNVRKTYKIALWKVRVISLFSLGIFSPYLFFILSKH